MAGREWDGPSPNETDREPDEGLDLLVASAGGHLTQLLALRESLGLSDRCLWVTYDSSQGRELAEREPVVFGHGPSTRNARAAIRNATLARRVYTGRRVARVVSTGAGIAVPFLAQAARRGIEALYVESATRAEGPSLSGRILEKVPGVVCAAQWAWGRRGWQQVPSVFDGFQSQPVSDTRVGDGGRRILVALGTHSSYRFDRLVAQVARVVHAEDRVLWQLGATPAPANATKVVDAVAPPEFDALLEDCDVVIGHAGLGTALKALEAGKLPILVPRRRLHGEHVDDHQHALAWALHQSELALAREVDDLTADDMALALQHAVTRQNVSSWRT